MVTNIKPKKCCRVGTYEHTVAMPIKKRVQGIDLCLTHIVAALNAANIPTAESCCGHGEIPPAIMLEDDRYVVILTREEYDKMPFNERG